MQTKNFQFYFQNKINQTNFDLNEFKKLKVKQIWVIDNGKFKNKLLRLIMINKLYLS